ncbi:unnamed protein product [Polarella glacialis]|uniref:Uncharacterized protein n=1 Tax=Polarella glacialis TaxID=89957 RepID=A0A813D5S5_POLGL|nr:unnamed protein product [Polarella glacialis]
MPSRKIVMSAHGCFDEMRCMFNAVFHIRLRILRFRQALQFGCHQPRTLLQAAAIGQTRPQSSCAAYDVFWVFVCSALSSGFGCMFSPFLPPARMLGSAQPKYFIFETSIESGHTKLQDAIRAL